MNTVAASVRRASIARELAPFLEGIGIAVLAGLMAGVLVGGVGGRIVMRISGFLSDPVFIGSARTANDNVVGEVTLGGTFALVFFVGVFGGAFGGLLWAAVGPWFAPLGRWRGLAFGLYLLALVGAAVAFDPDNFDFRRFGPPVLNVVLFAALFPLFGLVAVPLADAFERAVRERRDWIGVALRIAAWLALIPAAMLLVIGTTGAIDALRGGTTEFSLAAQMGLATLLLAFGLRLWGRTGRLSYAVLAVPLAVSAYTTLTAIAGILVR